MINSSRKLSIALALAVFLSGCTVSETQSNSELQNTVTAKYASVYESQFGFLPGYIKSDAELPNGKEIFPLPNKAGSPEFFRDFTQYQLGKNLRNTKRGDDARLDENWGMVLLTRFNDVYDIKISNTNTPELWNLIQHAETDINNAVTKMKENEFRTRPYVQFKEKTGKPESERIFEKTSSYPSGHTAFGWGAALILSEINTENQEAILKKGFEIGQSRVILGYHYQSDVDTARFLASMTVAKLHSIPEFQAQLEKAKAEFANKTLKVKR